MPTLEFTSDFAAPLQAVWDFYDTTDSLPLVTPPSTKVRLENAPRQMYEGARFFLIVRQPPIYVPLRWETIVTRRDPPHVWIDEQGKGPFAYWHHEHHFQALPDGKTRLRDQITYRPPFGPLGAIADFLFIRRQLTAMFRYRHDVTRRELESPKK